MSAAKPRIWAASEILVALMSLFGRGARFDEETVNVVLDPGKSTLLESLWALQNIIREALHVERGHDLSHLWEGKRLVWQAGLQVYGNILPKKENSNFLIVLIIKIYGSH
jgi:hypothetical protein